MTPAEGALISAAKKYFDRFAPMGPQGVDGTPLGDLWEAMDQLWGPDEQLGWLPATFADCLAGDRIRIGDQESDVLWTTGPQQFHVRNREWTGDDGKVRDHAVGRWDHIELRMDLSANPGRREYVPSTACEILCTPERAAKLELSTLFHPVQPVDK